MNDIEDIKRMSGIINESKYGTKFDNLKAPFKSNGKKVMDDTSTVICECNTNEMAKEIANILGDIRKLRELCERLMTLPKS